MLRNPAVWLNRLRQRTERPANRVQNPQIHRATHRFMEIEVSSCGRCGQASSSPSRASVLDEQMQGHQRNQRFCGPICDSRA